MAGTLTLDPGEKKYRWYGVTAEPDLVGATIEVALSKEGPWVATTLDAGEYRVLIGTLAGHTDAGLVCLEVINRVYLRVSDAPEIEIQHVDTIVVPPS